MIIYHDSVSNIMQNCYIQILHHLKDNSKYYSDNTFHLNNNVDVRVNIKVDDYANYVYFSVTPANVTVDESTIAETKHSICKIYEDSTGLKPLEYTELFRNY